MRPYELITRDQFRVAALRPARGAAVAVPATGAQMRREGGAGRLQSVAWLIRTTTFWLRPANGAAEVPTKVLTSPLITFVLFDRPSRNSDTR